MLRRSKIRFLTFLVFTSTDGFSWTMTHPYSEFKGASYLPSLGGFVIFGRGAVDIIYFSKNGTNFAPFVNLSHSLQIPIRDVHNIIESDDGFLAAVEVVGEYAVYVIFSPKDNVQKWAVIYQTFGEYGYITYMNKMYNLASYLNSHAPISVFYSDGISSNWKFQNSVNGITFPQPIPDAQVWMGTLAESRLPYLKPEGGVLQRSADGISWDTYNTGIVEPITNFFYSSKMGKYLINTIFGKIYLS
jgi:hypothetical protein